MACGRPSTKAALAGAFGEDGMSSRRAVGYAPEAGAMTIIAFVSAGVGSSDITVPVASGTAGDRIWCRSPTGACSRGDPGR